MKTKDVYSAAIKKYGKISQLIMCMEEMSELIKELSKSFPRVSGAQTIPARSLRKWPTLRSC